MKSESQLDSDFVNITSNDQWFKQHPEKIAGVEVKTTSLLFPIQVKGTKEDVIKVIYGNDNSKKIKLAQIKLRLAKAKLNLIDNEAI